MGLAATHLLAYVITGRYQLTAHNSTAGERLADEVHKQSDINWLTHQVFQLVLKSSLNIHDIFMYRRLQ